MHKMCMLRMIRFRTCYNMSSVSLPQENPREPQHGTWALTRSERIALLLFFVLALGYAGWQYYSRSRQAVELGEDIPHPGGGIVVQVEGAVETPGLVYLPHGARVSDAIEAAGGFSSGADAEALNLAETVEDGERIDVPWLEDAEGQAANQSGRVVVRVPPPGYSGPDRDTGGGTRRVSYPVNINTAGSYELESLPGIGEELARRIIEYRGSHGRFETIEEITRVEGIGEGRFEAIRDLITVGD
jgi:comEA protein